MFVIRQIIKLLVSLIDTKHHSEKRINTKYAYVIISVYVVWRSCHFDSWKLYDILGDAFTSIVFASLFLMLRRIGSIHFNIMMLSFVAVSFFALIKELTVGDCYYNQITDITVYLLTYLSSILLIYQNKSK